MTSDMARVKPVLTLTLNPSLDVTTSVDEVRHTDKLRCSAPMTDPGGGGVNVARVIARLGGTACAMFAAGGPNGRALEDLIAAEGIVSLPVPIVGSTRQSFTAFEVSTRRQYRFVLPGPALEPAEWQTCRDRVGAALAGVDYLVASGSLPPGVPEDFYAQIARLARGRDVRLILDTSGAALAAALEQPLFLIKPNARELRALAGDMSLDDDGLIAFARTLVRAGRCEIVALSLGERGAALITPDLALKVASPAVAIESAVGAGDSFVGALTLALARGDDLASVLRYGVAAGSAALLTPGTELCRASDVARLYRELAAG
jgi:6-phosphofructokinase 2